MVTTVAQNVLTGPTKTVYLNEPMDKGPDEEDKTEPQDAPESDEPTSANLSQEDEKYKKRYDDLKGHYDRTIGSLKLLESRLNALELENSELKTKTTSSTATTPTMPKTPEEFKAFKEKYPELADMITTAAMMVSANSSGAVEQKLKQLEEKTNAVSAKEGIAELKKYHPDFEQIKDDPRFIEWFGMQPPEIKNLIRSTNPKVIATGLDRFKEYAGIKTPVQKAEAKKDATRDISTPNRVKIGEGQKRTYTNDEIKKMSMKEFETLQEDIKAAQYDGRIVG